MNISERLNNILLSFRGRLSKLPISVRAVGFATVIAFSAVALTEQSGILQRLELDVYDALVRSLPDQAMDDRLLIVAVTESDTVRFGNPLNDATLAQVIEAVRRGNPRAIALGLYRHIEHPPGTELLSEQLNDERVVGMRFVGSDTVNSQVPAPVALPRERVGFGDLVVDPDGVVRRALLYVGGNPDHFSFALRTVLAGFPNLRAQFGVADEAIFFGDASIPRLKTFSGGYARADHRGYQTLLRYRSRRPPAEIVPVGDLLDGRMRPGLIEDRIVLIGTTDLSLADEFYTPYSAALEGRDFTMTSIVAHAQMVSYLLDISSGETTPFIFLPRIGEWAWLFFWTLTAALLSWLMRNPVLSLVSVLVVALSVFLVGWIALLNMFWPPQIAPVMAAFIASAIATIMKYLHKSSHDSVTDLPGRQPFLNRLGKALGKLPATGPIAVALLDIDRFQVINKAMGHAAGDRLLVVISERLRDWLGGESNIARVAGDEFAILFRGIDAESMDEEIRAIRQMLAVPVQLESRTVSMSVSVGVAFVPPDSQPHPEALLRHAHTAMYRAKARKNVQLEVFSPHMGDDALKRLDLESDLLDAAHQQEFFLVYQPVINLQTGVVSGFEALIRWQNERRGLVGPDDFIPILEETGMIVSVGEWILETACQQISKWRQAFPDLDLQVNVNLSGRQIDEPGLEAVIEANLARHRLPPESLQLELTESIIMRDVESTQQLMTAFRELGVGLAIDDFGTGYSSLSYLHRFPSDTLKIDRAFVENLTHNDEDRNIVYTIIALGQRLKMTLVAEGIETAEQATALREAGCQFAQGYFFAKPLVAEDATRLLEEGRQWS